MAGNFLKNQGGKPKEGSPPWRFIAYFFFFLALFFLAGTRFTSILVHCMLVEGSTAGEIERGSARRTVLHLLCSHETLGLFLSSLSLGFYRVHSDASPLLNTHSENNASTKFIFSSPANSSSNLPDPWVSCSRAELIEHARVRLHEPDEKLRLEQPERSHVRARLGKPIEFV
jgi:hypothetical protein